ncbi:MAG: hypothetical protein C7N36_04355 [Bacteroidetes bacterium]|nr:MAG: hypothetical protein C7N36_04355 [Bacteroidota bacterium]
MGDIYKKTNDIETLLVWNYQIRREDFNDVGVSANFIISKNELLALTMKKPGALFTHSVREYWESPWIIDYVLINVFDKNIPKGFPAFNKIKLSNYTPIYSKQSIYYDFFKMEEKVFLLILSDNTLLLYENIGILADNNWLLIHTYNDFPIQGFFRIYKDKFENIILGFDSNQFFVFDEKYDFLSPKKTDLNIEKMVLVHNQIMEQYSWLTSEEAHLMIKSEDPIKFFLTVLKQED